MTVLTLTMLPYCFAMIVGVNCFVKSNCYFECYLSRYFKYSEGMHFDNIYIINEATYEVDISHIFRYSSAMFKIISEHKQRYKNT